MLTKQELLQVVNYNPGGCLCGHGESCSVCSRGDSAREFERLARRAALELLEMMGVRLKKSTLGLWSGTVYSIDED